MTTRLDNLSRRHLLQGIAGGGLVLGIEAAGLVAPFAAWAGAAKPANDLAPSVYLSIDEAGEVTIIEHRSEMGQGIRSSLPMVLADELEADWARVKVQQAVGDESRYGDQNTDGSRSIRNFYMPFRQAGAAARQMLEAAAAERWGVAVDQVEARNHQVIHKPSGRALGYGELVATARDLPAPKADSLKLKPMTQFRYIGKGVTGIDLQAMTTGRAKYGIDQAMPGMKYAVIARCPVYGGKVRSVDTSAALKVAGVERVVQLETTPPPSGFLPLGGVAVIARNTWAAIEGREQLKIDWDFGPNASYDSIAFRRELEETARKPGKTMRNLGDAPGALASAPRRLTAEYYVPLLAHAPMEPPAALAHFADGKCEVWAATQNPQGARETLAKALGIPVADTIVHVTLLGGGFGRKSKPDYIAEAGLLSRAVGAPVKVTWTREDELQHDYFNAVSAQRLEAALGADGRPSAWLHRTVLTPIPSTFSGAVYGSPNELGQGFVDMPYDIPNIRCENGPATAHIRIGWYRSVANIYHAFAVCSFADELAHATGRDPKDYLLELIGPPRHVDLKAQGVDYVNYGADQASFPVDTGRLRGVLERVAQESGWGKPLPKGHARGIAVHRSFVTYVATVVEIALADGKLAIPRVDVAVDCGRAVNPDRVRSQFEGAVIMGLSNALFGEITVSKGQVDQSNFNDYQVATMDVAPVATHIHIIDSDAPPGGVGEPGVPPFAPALCNAIFAATGKRIRQLPIAGQLSS